MPARDRFLSIRVVPPNGAIAWLVLELMDGQGFLYTLGEDRKIIDALPFASENQAFQHVEITFDISRVDWIEDMTH